MLDSTIPPKVSIVVPVYNVEAFLPQCLDSVISQTLRDIQILCVNDGSTDRCAEILERYAEKDPRITVIEKKNGGLSSARNAAYPRIRGKYTLFIDSDDFVEPTLCEKTYDLAEKKNADMVFFLYHSTDPESRWFPLEDFLKIHPWEQIDRQTLLAHMCAWSKLWKTEFLLSRQILFPEGICFEDNVAHWKALLLEPEIALLPERLYWYRFQENSITNNMNSPKIIDVVSCYRRIRDVLLERDRFQDPWSSLYYKKKLSDLCSWYVRIDEKFKPEMLRRIRESLEDGDLEYLKAGGELLGRFAPPFYQEQLLHFARLSEKRDREETL